MQATILFAILTKTSALKLGDGKIILQGVANLSEFNVRGNVIISGGPGNDVIYCKIDSDRINFIGGSGMDILHNYGDDVLFGGGPGEDVIPDYAAIEKNSADAGKAYNFRSLENTIANEYRQQRLKQLNQRGRGQRHLIGRRGRR